MFVCLLKLDLSSGRCNTYLANAGGMFATLNLTIALSDVTLLSGKCWSYVCNLEFDLVDFELKKVLLPRPLGNFADICYLEENFKPHLLRDVCTLYSGGVSL